MKKAATKPASSGELTVAQLSAVDLLAAGKNDTETAEALSLNRVTVTRWRLYSLGFRAALAERRAAIWGAAADKLRALLPKALDALAEALEGEDKATVALAVLKLAGPLPVLSDGPTDAEEILRLTVEKERRGLRSTNDEMLDGYAGRPPFDAHMETVRARLARLAEPVDAV